MSAATSLSAALHSGELSFRTLADGTAVILDLRRQQVLSLNATGASILRELAAGTTNVASLAAGISEEFEVDIERAQSEVTDFLTCLCAQLGHSD